MGTGLEFFIFAATTIDANAKSRNANNRRAEAERIRQKQADIQTQRERVKQIREARKARAGVQAATAGGEATGGSGAQGVIQGITSQVSENLSFLDTQQQISGQISDLNVSAAGLDSSAATSTAIGGVATGYKSLFDA